MTKFLDLKEKVDSLRCPTCHGLGEYDDAGIGDITFNTYRCSPCRGTGFKDGQAHQITPVPGDSVR